MCALGAIRTITQFQRRSFENDVQLGIVRQCKLSPAFVALFGSPSRRRPSLPGFASAGGLRSGACVRRWTAWRKPSTSRSSMLRGNYGESRRLKRKLATKASLRTALGRGDAQLAEQAPFDGREGIPHLQIAHGALAFGAADATGSQAERLCTNTFGSENMFASGWVRSSGLFLCAHASWEGSSTAKGANGERPRRRLPNCKHGSISTTISRRDLYGCSKTGLVDRF